MRLFSTRLTKLLFFVFFPGMLFAQTLKDYTLQLSSGKYLPEENRNTVSKQSTLFQQSLFNGKHYVTIQFMAIPDETTKAKLNDAGIALYDYIPNYAYTASISESVDLNVLKTLPIRSILQFTTEQKMPASLFKGVVPVHAVKQVGYADVVITTYEKIGAEKITTSLNAIGASIIANQQIFNNYTIRVPAANVNALAILPFIQWVEPIDPPNVLENAQGRSLHRVNVLSDGARNLKGDGINIGIWDGGQVNLNHIDFSPAGRVTIVRAGAVSDHATHVAGTITGKGIGNPVARGMAPNATLFSWDFNTNIQTEMATEIPGRNLLVSSHSYGSGGTPTCNLSDPLGVYSTTSRNTDVNLNNNPSHLHVHSAGNSGGSCAGGFMTITGSGKSAKNNLVVSNVTTTEAISGSSSRGPVQDGRIKPEISAMGTNVFSTWIPNSTYATISGTSMATPGVSGTSALLYQRYKQLNGNANPTSALIKNVICNSAQDIGNAGPDYTFGFGRIDALSAVEILESIQTTPRYAVNTVTNGSFNDVNVTVPAGTVLLKAMLTWNDPAGAANANPALVNDLDLSVINGATTTLPWIMDKNVPGALATRGVDNYSNIEQVTITNPPAGTYTLKVNGTNITTGPNQQYALTWIIEQAHIEVLFPNGGENFIPGNATGANIQYITWNTAGITGNQTVEYSTDNGSNWTTIATVGPTITRQIWNPIPSVNTSTALVRITSGSVSDVSDANFSIMGQPILQYVSAAACLPGEISYTWTAVGGATHYDLYRLDQSTGDLVIMASNIVGTGHTVTGLTPGATIWAALVAKNNTTGAVSPRSNAVSGAVSTGGGGLSPIGSITGQSNVCGNIQVQYTVPIVTGATSYTWTSPPNTTIASGQGTNTILVNFFAGSSSGNVTVFASAGSCQTSTATLPVNFSSDVNPPTSGGNQTSNICHPTPIPTLTATATVPGGHTLTWFTAANGGSVVANPTLNTPGTITYYASSTNNSSGCTSAARTPVTLTINYGAAASISAGGPLTFCQGSNVALTANTGTSYIWRNGATQVATTQIYTATTSGSYTVEVTTGTCVSTSAATVVTVNPAPVAAITAGGPLTFCQGLNVVLTASTGSSWLWNNGATTQAITVTTSGNYSVTVTNSSGCSNTSATTNVTVNPNPPAVITASGPITFCQGGSVILTANTGNSYLWSTGATTQSITVSSSGNYTVDVTQAGGCVSSSPATNVVVNPLPAATITAGGPLAFCNGNNVVLSAPGGGTWIWRNGATQVATSQLYTATTSGAYTVQVTTAAGCSSTSTVTNVAVSPNPVATLTAAPYSKLFPGLKTTLTVSVNPAGTYNYTWLRNGNPVPGAVSASIPNIDLNGLGTYTVTVTNSTGLPCTNTSNAIAIGDSVSSKLFVYPNPSKGVFQVQFYTTNPSAHTVSIFDSKGAVVYKKEYNLNIPYQQMDVNISKHGAGVYQVILHDRAGKKLAVRQIVIAQ